MEIIKNRKGALLSVIFLSHCQCVSCSSHEEVYAGWWFWASILVFVSLFLASLKEALKGYECCKCCKCCSFCHCCRRRSKNFTQISVSTKFWQKARRNMIKDRPSHILTAVPQELFAKKVVSTYHQTSKRDSEQFKIPRTQSVSNSKVGKPPVLQVHVIQVDPDQPHPLGLGLPREKTALDLTAALSATPRSTRL